MGDVDGPSVAKRVYQEIFSTGQELLDPDDVAYGLDAAIRELRKEGVHPSRWATYVHLGI